MRIDGHPATMNSVIAAEHLKTAMFKPDGKSMGPAGTLDILVEDGRGGSVAASLPDHRAIVPSSARVWAGRGGWRSPSKCWAFPRRSVRTVIR